MPGSGTAQALVQSIVMKKKTIHYNTLHLANTFETKQLTVEDMIIANNTNRYNVHRKYTEQQEQMHWWHPANIS